MNKTDLEKVLQDIGFNEKESRVYLTLLELKEALPSSIARLSSIKRPTTYLVLDQLEKKGLVSHIKRSGHLYFQACKPEFLIQKQREYHKNVEKKLSDLEKVLPELNLLHKDFQNTPQMSVFRGKEGLIQIMEDTLNTKGEIFCWSNTDLAVNTILREYHPTYLRKKVKRQIKSKCLFTKDHIGLSFKKKSKEQLREVHFIGKGKFKFVNEINIYDDKVAIISHEDEIGVIIQNKSIAETQRAIFDFCFELTQD